MRSEREAKISDVNKPVIGLRPLKERNKRSEAMIGKTLRKKINSVFSRTTRGERIQRSCLRDHFKHLTAFYVNICFIAQYTKIHDTYRFLLFVFLIFFSLDFLPTARPLLKQNNNTH